MFHLRMDGFRIPNKKPRLEEPVSKWKEDDALDNDDLWGQGELTAEEFDMLEIQASQMIEQRSIVDVEAVSHIGLQSRCTQTDDDFKQEIYALEGQIISLKESLDKNMKELHNERLNRENVISQRTEHFKQKENDLQKKIEKMKTSEQFKEQEMKNLQDKVLSLELKIREKGEDVNKLSSQLSQKPSSGKKSSNLFLNRFDFENKIDLKTNEASTQTSVASFKRLAHVVPVNFPKGRISETCIVSHLLSHRTELLFPNIFLPCGKRFNILCKKRLTKSQMPLARLNIGHETGDLWKSYIIQLRTHIEFLKLDGVCQIFQNASKLGKTPVKPGDFFVPHSGTFQSSVLCREVETRHAAIIMCLKNLIELLAWRCPPNIANSKTEMRNESKKNSGQLDLTSSCSNMLFSGNNGNLKTTLLTGHGLLDALIVLAVPSSYPEGYCKEDEVIHALCALFAWSSKEIARLEPVFYKLPLHSFISGHHGVRCAYFSLKLLCNLITLRNFKLFLIHQTGACLFNSVASFCNCIDVNNFNENSVIFTLQVSELICLSFSVLGTEIMNAENCFCDSALVENFILLLWKHYKLSTKNVLASQLNVLKKGIIVLHQMLLHLRKFKDKRSRVEDNYVSIILGIAKMCKEKSEFKPFLNIVHDLCDFQDNSELNIDELMNTQDFVSKEYST